MTVANPSFEVPSGTAPSVTGTNLGPFDLIEGTFLDVEVTGAGDLDGIYRWTVELGPFGGLPSDILGVTALNVANVINNAGIPGFGASATGPGAGFLVIDGRINGSTIRVAGGQPVSVFQLPTTPVAGTENFGPGQDWTINAVSQFLEWGGFNASEFELPVETFEAGWFSLLPFILSTEFVETFEFGWNTVVTGGGNLAAGLFDGFPFEPFESGWNLFTVSTTFFTFGFDAGSETDEDFENGWNITPQTSPFTLEDGVFNDTVGATAEGFEIVININYVVEINTSLEGQYLIEINGVPYTYDAGPADGTADIAAALATAIDNDAVFTAQSFFNQVWFFPTERQVTNTEDDDVIRVRGPSSGDMSYRSARDDTSTLFRSAWVGQDQLATPL